MPIVFSKTGGENDVLFGKFEHPIRIFIEEESNNYKKNEDLFNILFNVEKSDRYSETYTGQSGMGEFQATKEGARGENDTVSNNFKRTTEHVTFKKEFSITREMADDSKLGISADMKRPIKGFVKAYHDTRTNFGFRALINGTSASMTFNQAEIDLRTGDGLSLFNNAHKFANKKMGSKTQSNFFYSNTLCASADELESSLATLKVMMRNFRTEDDKPSGYVANLLLLPCNRPGLEKIANEVINSQKTTGNGNNNINTQYASWSMAVLPGWETTDDRFIVMSTEANEALEANVFYDRTDLEVKSHVDNHTWNYEWSGYCRMSVGFNTWKHILLAVDSNSSVAGATNLNA